MKKLKMTDAQDFRIHIEKTIEEDNLFFHEYQIAVDNLNRIWESQRALEKSKESIGSEYPNNIIAFCGERGSGKSSVMLSFMNAIVNSGKGEDRFDFLKEIRTNNWSTNIIIDPSMFDGVHNIVDIVLAHIYHAFDDFYNEDNQRIDKYDREKMLKLLAKVYKSLSIIKNKEKMMDDEYDVAGNIAKLQKLGESTQLRESFIKLIDFYLELIWKPEKKTDRKSEKILIAIDDLDLCNEHAYEMAEQIRKYLVLPNVVILMAIKIEQLEMGVEEKNREDFRNVIASRRGDFTLEQEIRGMAERYVTKLIPKARRIYLPNLECTQVCLELCVGSQKDDAEVGTDTIENIIIKLIREKMGMIFVPSENSYNYLIPKNLREFINLISLLGGMRQPDDSSQIKLENIYEFQSYFIEEILKKNIDGEKLSDLLEILESDDNSMNSNMDIYIDNLLSEKKKVTNVYQTMIYEFPNTSLAAIVEKLNIGSWYLTKRLESQLLYYIKIYYTILLNERLQEKGKISDKLFGGYLWGNAVNHIVSSTLIDKSRGWLCRERFFIHIIPCWNAIADTLKEWNGSLAPEKKDDSRYYVSGIKDENKLSEIMCWLLLVLIACPSEVHANGKRFMYKGTVVYNNHMVLSSEIAVSVENYIANLCSLQDLYDSANLELLGIPWEDMFKIFSVIEEKNIKLIEQSKAISVNVDLSMHLLAYCRKKADYKEEASEDRTYKLLKRFFKNISNYLEENSAGKVDWSKFWIPTSINEQNEVVDGDYIDICRVYAKVFEAEEKILKEQASSESLGGTSLSASQKQSFVQQVGHIALEDYTARINAIPKYLKNKTSRYVKDILENIANGIQKYTYREKKYPDNFDVQRLINLYSEVVDLYMENPGKDISEKQHNEYKEIAKIADKIVQRG